MVSGMYQTTLGTHNHRSQTSSGKGSGNAKYYGSYHGYPSGIKLIPEIFRDAGYFVTNKSKTDYNFIPNRQLYYGSDWMKAPPGKS